MARNLGGAVGQLTGGDLQRATAATCTGGCSPSRPARTQRPTTTPATARGPWAEAIGTALLAINAIPLRR